MRISLIGVLAALTLTVAACSGGPADMTQPDKKAVEGADGAQDAKPTPKVEEVTTGDVEQKVALTATVAEGGKSPSVRVDEVKDPRNRINLVTADVYQPFPANLPLLFRVKSERGWPNAPVVIRAKAFIEGQSDPIGQMQFVFGEKAEREPPQEMEVDLMPALSSIPETLMVSLRAEALLMPVGTDPASVDPATATTSEMRTTGLISNALRINFHQAPAPPAPESEAVAPNPAIPLGDVNIFNSTVETPPAAPAPGQ